MDPNNLKYYRKQSGFTQEQLAEKIGVSRQAIAKWEKGETLPDIDNVIALADLYEISVDSLVRNMAKGSGTNMGGKHMFGVVRMNDKGQVTLPKKCRSVFGLKANSMLLVLGDEDRGIALVKINEFFGG